MRRKVTKATLQAFMQGLAKAARSPGKVYLTGGATALLLGFREQTIDIDLRLDPEPAGAFEAIASLKNELDLNVELASPSDFIPVPPNWRDRSRHIVSFGQVEFFHFDFTLQALAKIERGYEQDLEDARRLLDGGFVQTAELVAVFNQIRPGLLRYPALDARAFEQKLRSFLAQYK